MINIDVPKSVLRAEIKVLYSGILFSVGSDIRWIISNHRFSIFTEDAELAEKLEFRRIDKFEYEKTISVDDVQTAYITLYTENAEQLSMTPAEFKEWLDSFKVR